MLVDQELLHLIRSGLVTNIDFPKDEFHKASPVQPASIDFHVGAIYKPQQDADKPGGFNNPVDEVVLEPGEMVIVQTHEAMMPPGDIGAIGMPPAHLALQGLLILNPGHIDPGYRGNVKLTIINMARVQLPINRGQEIFTIVFFRCSQPAKVDYEARRAAATPTTGVLVQSPVEQALGKLSQYFMNLEERMRHIGQEEASRASLHLQGWQRLLGFLSLVVTIGLLSAGISLAYKYAALETTQQLLQERKSLTQSVSDLAHRIVALEQQVAARSSGVHGSSKGP